ncbi:MAG: AAA family ATPase [Desulfobacterales bacterium]
MKNLTGLVIIDEVQRKPEWFELLRVLVDRPGQNARFLLLGSASPQLVKGISESLAGRIGFVDLSGFQLWEIGMQHRDQLWIRGGLPRAFLAELNLLVLNGVKALSEHFSKEIFLSLASPLPRKPFGDSGRWWPITVGRYGMQRTSPEPLVLLKIRRENISIFLAVPTWFGFCRRGLRI